MYYKVFSSVSPVGPSGLRFSTNSDGIVDIRVPVPTPFPNLYTYIQGSNLFKAIENFSVLQISWEPCILLHKKNIVGTNIVGR